MANSWPELCNRALLIVGADSIMDLEEESPGAKACKLLLPGAVDSVLRSHEWSCAEAVVSVAADSTAPTIGFSYRYLLPVDPWALKVRKVCDEDANEYRYTVRGRYVETDCPAPAKIVITKRITDPTEVDALCADVIVLRLAADLAEKLVSSQSMRDGFMKEYLRHLAHAAAVDSNEISLSRTVDSDWLTTRGYTGAT
jgi:hypothetical protein